MSGANAISGIVILGAIILIRTTEPNDHFTLIIASLALLVGSINVFGGFLWQIGCLRCSIKRKRINGQNIIFNFCISFSLGS